jgi:hypothetical protein
MTVEYPQNVQPLALSDLRPTTEHHLFLMSLVDAVNAEKSETATGSNGRFWKFDNGNLFCWNRFSVGSITTNGAGTYANPYRSGAITWTFPEPFIAAPLVFPAPSIGDLGGLRNMAMAYTRGVTATTAAVQVGRGSSDATADVFAVDVLAVGRWK